MSPTGRPLFSWPVKLTGETYALVSEHGSQPAGGIGQAGPSSAYVGIVVYFPVDDADRALARAESSVVGAMRPTPLSAASPCSPTPMATGSGWSVADHGPAFEHPGQGDSSE